MILELVSSWHGAAAASSSKIKSLLKENKRENLRRTKMSRLEGPQKTRSELFSRVPSAKEKGVPQTKIPPRRYDPPNWGLRRWHLTFLLFWSCLADLGLGQTGPCPFNMMCTCSYNSAGRTIDHTHPFRIETRYTDPSMLPGHTPLPLKDLVCVGVPFAKIPRKCFSFVKV